MYFLFEDNSLEREALITAVEYDEEMSMYQLTLFGLDEESHNYIIPGTAWFEEDDFENLLNGKNLKAPEEVAGKKIMLSANKMESEGNNNE